MTAHKHLCRISLKVHIYFRYHLVQAQQRQSLHDQDGWVLCCTLSRTLAGQSTHWPGSQRWQLTYHQTHAAKRESRTNVDLHM